MSIASYYVFLRIPIQLYLPVSRFPKAEEKYHLLQQSQQVHGEELLQFLLALALEAIRYWIT